MNSDVKVITKSLKKINLNLKVIYSGVHYKISPRMSWEVLGKNCGNKKIYWWTKHRDYY